MFVHGHCLNKTNTPLLSTIPDHLNVASMRELVSIIDKAMICPGHPKLEYMEMAKARKGTFTGQDGTVKAAVDTHPVQHGGETFTSTVRTAKCSLLTDSPLCCCCKAYSPTLRAMYSRWSHKSNSVSKFTNNRYLKSPEKAEKLRTLQKRAGAAEREVKRLQEAIEKLTSEHGVIVEQDLHDDLVAIMGSNNEDIRSQFPEGSFRRLFWEQQFQCAQLKDPRQMRWHPMMIRLALCVIVAMYCYSSCMVYT